jgi:hypothetical protein
MLQKFALSLLVLCLAACRSGSGARHAHFNADDYRVTPGGLAHKSCVRELAANERVTADGRIVRTDGSTEQIPQCAFPRLDLKTFEPIHGDARALMASNWIEAAYWRSPRPLGSLAAEWFVPPAPKTYLGGTVYLFPGSQPSSFPAILQPVLQWGESFAGGGQYWSIAGYFCCPSGWTFNSPLITVNPGARIIGVMTSTCADSTCDWTVSAIDNTTGASTTLTASAVPWDFHFHAGGVLEAYNLEGCDEYPPNHAVSFLEIQLKDRSGRTMTPRWTHEIFNPSPPCKYGVESTPEGVTVRY